VKHEHDPFRLSLRECLLVIVSLTGGVMALCWLAYEILKGIGL
jgi:hypothetical protein